MPAHVSAPDVHDWGGGDSMRVSRADDRSPRCCSDGSGVRPWPWVATDLLFIAVTLGLLAVAATGRALSVRWEEPWAQRTALSPRSRSGSWHDYTVLQLVELRLIANASAVERAGSLPPNGDILTAGKFPDTQWAATRWCIGAGVWAAALIVWAGMAACLLKANRGGPWLADHYGDPFYQSPMSLPVCIARYGVVPAAVLAVTQALLTHLLLLAASAELDALCAEVVLEWELFRRTLLASHELKTTPADCSSDWGATSAITITWLAVAVCFVYAVVHAAQDCTVACCSGTKEPVLARIGEAVRVGLGVGDQPQAAEPASPRPGQPIAASPRPSPESDCPERMTLLVVGKGQRIELRVGDPVSYRADDGSWRAGASIECIYDDLTADVRTFTQKLVRRSRDQIAAAAAQAEGSDAPLGRADDVLSDGSGPCFLESLTSSQGRLDRPTILRRRMDSAERRLAARDSPSSAPLTPPSAQLSASQRAGSFNVQPREQPPAEVRSDGSSSSSSDAATNGFASPVRRWLAKWSKRRGDYFYYSEDEHGELGPTVWRPPPGAVVSLWEGGPRNGSRVSDQAVRPIALHDSRCPWVRCASGEIGELSTRVRTVSPEIAVYTYSEDDSARLDCVATYEGPADPEASAALGGGPCVAVKFGDGAVLPWRCCDLLVYAPPQGGSAFLWAAMDRRREGWLRQGSIHSYLSADPTHHDRSNWAEFMSAWQHDADRRVEQHEFCTAWDRAFGRRPRLRSQWARGGCGPAAGLARHSCGRWRNCDVRGALPDGTYSVLWDGDDGDDAEGVAVIVVPAASTPLDMSLVTRESTAGDPSLRGSAREASLRPGNGSLLAPTSPLVTLTPRSALRGSVLSPRRKPRSVSFADATPRSN